MPDRKSKGHSPIGYNGHELDDAGRSSGARAIVVVPILPRHPREDRDADPSRPRLNCSPEARRDEAVGLARAIELDPVHVAIVTINDPRPATLLGSGKVEELAGIVAEKEAELVIVDHALTPVQQRNLETALKAKVLDRTGLILEIFGRRARTKEGTLQVELAHLEYQRGRLVRSWTHLERQRGGGGFLGGPGETQIEFDRRMLQEKILKLKRELEVVRRTRDLHRAKRRKVPFPVVAIVGYTNAGKSTLFNKLTGATVLAQDMLFATLDPTLRRVRLPHGTPVILSDTVGFISDLPTHLVAAFRATLEEVVEADLILHLRDISDPDTAAQADDVERILADLSVDARDTERVLEVWNKIDQLDEFQPRATAGTTARRSGKRAHRNFRHYRRRSAETHRADRGTRRRRSLACRGSARPPSASSSRLAVPQWRRRHARGPGRWRRGAERGDDCGSARRNAGPDGAFRPQLKGAC